VMVKTAVTTRAASYNAMGMLLRFDLCQ